MRPSGITNQNAFLSQPFKFILFTFFPTHFDFIHFFGGYRLIPYQMGYSTLFLPIALLFRKNYFKHRNIVINTLIISVIISLVLLSTPEQFLWLRYAFRFMPMFTISATILTFYILDKYPKVYIKQRIVIYILLVLLSGLSSYFTVLNNDSEFMTRYILANIVSIVLALFAYFSLRGNSIISAQIITFTILPMMLYVLPSLGIKERYMASPILTGIQQINYNNINKEGYILGMAPRYELPKINVATFNSSMFGLYDIASINGYSPNYHKGLLNLIPFLTPHTLFEESGLKTLLQEDSIIGNDCIINALNISSISIRINYYPNIEKDIIKCGFNDLHNIDNHTIVANRPKQHQVANMRYLPYLSPAVKEEPIITKGRLVEAKIAKRTQETIAIFPRLYYPGYQATFNGQPISIEPYHDTFLMLRLPAGDEGILKLEYFPSTWKKMWFLSLLALLALFGLFIYTQSHAKTVTKLKNQQSTSS